MKKTIVGFCGVALTLAMAPVADPASAEGDAANGKTLFNKGCAICHPVEAGKHKAGPSVFGIYGAKAGTAEGYTRYIGLKDSDVVWDDTTLDGFLADPKGFVGGPTRMPMAVRDAAARVDLIAYMKTLK